MNLKDFLPKNIGEMSRVVSNPYAHSFVPFKEEDLDEELKEGFGGELKGAAKRKFETERKKNAEVLGYKMVPEASVTGNLDGGEGPPKTPYAFQSTKKKRKKDKEKEKKISTNSTGYTIAEDIYVALVSKTGRQFTGKQPRFNPRNLGHPGLLVTTADKIFKSEVGRNLSQKLANKLKITKRYNQKGLQGSKKTADRGTRQYIDAIGGVIKSKMVPEIPNGRTMPVTKRLDLVFANSQSQLDNVLKGKYKVVKESVNEVSVHDRMKSLMKSIVKSEKLKSVKDMATGKGAFSFFMDDEKESKKLATLLKKHLKRVRIIKLDKSKGDKTNFVVAADMLGLESVQESEQKKIEKLLLKYGNNKKDTKGIMKWYGRVSKMYKKANPAKKAQIMNSLWAQNEGTCGYGEDGKLGDEPAGPHLLKKKNESKTSNMMKSVRKGPKVGPWDIIVSKNNKVVKRVAVQNLKEIPAEMDDVRKKFPNHKIGIESKVGKIVYRESMNKRQGGETLKQLGGNKFIAMTGAKNFAVGPKGMSFKIGRNSKGVNYVRIDLDRGKDLYNMEFIQMRAGKLKVKSKVKGVYNDQLQKMFTKHTGMYTSLGTMGR